MPLEVGPQIAHYSVTALIGEGGMGQVYQATDTKLNRQVALKILPEAFAADPDRLARFEREARVLASLNHPGIAQIHGLEEQDGIKALVLELVEGPTLADRIAQGPIPVDEALPIAKQIAEALEAAHEQGIIHRDLKPANIKLRSDGTVKVLDFGLAKALDTAPEGDPNQSPTLTAAATQMGVIMGTAAYMSPEQARGKPVDKRADIWAFGCVLFEMLTSVSAFSGDTVSDTLANILDREPDWQRLPTGLPTAISTYLRRCLDRDAKQRVQAIGDVRLALSGAFEPIAETHALAQASSPPWRWRAVILLIAGVALGATFAGTLAWTLMQRTDALAMRLTLVAPPGVTSLRKAVLSPDGTMVAFGGTRAGTAQVFVRSLDRLQVRPVAGTEGMHPVTFSPDGLELLVRSDLSTGAAVMRVSVDGGSARPLVADRLGEGERRGGQAAWGPDGTIVLGGAGSTGLGVIASLEGEVVPLTTLAEGESGHADPTILPGGRAVLFSVYDADGTSSIEAVDRETRERMPLIDGAAPRYLGSGHLVFFRDNAIWAAAFDPDRLELRGDAVLIEEGVGTLPGGRGFYDVATSGTLVYAPVAAETNAVVWVNRRGEMVGTITEGVRLAWPRLSPDGARMAFHRHADGAGNIWIRALDSGSETKLTEHAAIDIYPTWEADGASVLFTATRLPVFQIFRRRTDLSGPAERLRRSGENDTGGARAPDGRSLVYYTVQGQDRDIWHLPASGKPVPIVETPYSDRAPQLSPDGQWLLYVSNRSGENRVYVQAYPDGKAVFPVSVGPGVEAMWSRDGSEIFYRTGSEMWVVEVEAASEFDTASSTLLFTADYERDFSGADWPNYDVSLDGQQFLMVRTTPTVGPGYVVVQDWVEELERRVPVD